MKEKKKMVVKNCLGELSNSSFQRRTHDCFGELPSNSPRRVVQYIYRNSVVSFREQKPFVLKTVFCSHWALACVRESVRTRDMGLGMWTFK